VTSSEVIDDKDRYVMTCFKLHCTPVAAVAAAGGGGGGGGGGGRCCV